MKTKKVLYIDEDGGSKLYRNFGISTQI